MVLQDFFIAFLTNDTYIIGWQDDWDNLISMTPAV